jgi:hypothetical protein
LLNDNAIRLSLTESNYLARFLPFYQGASRR